MKNILTLPILLSGLTVSASTSASLSVAAAPTSTLNKFQVTEDARFKNTLFFAPNVKTVLSDGKDKDKKTKDKNEEKSDKGNNPIIAQIARANIRLPAINLKSKFNLGGMLGFSPISAVGEFKEELMWKTSNLSVLADVLWLISNRISVGAGVGVVVGTSEFRTRAAGRFMFAATPSINVGVSATCTSVAQINEFKTLLSDGQVWEFAAQFALSQDLLG